LLNTKWRGEKPKEDTKEPLKIKMVNRGKKKKKQALWPVKWISYAPSPCLWNNKWRGEKPKEDTKEPNKNQKCEKREEEKKTSTMTSKMEPPMPQVLVVK
jgi:hypothetical protein